MSESIQQNQPPIEQLPSDDERLIANARYHESLDAISQLIPEVAENNRELADAGNEIIGQFAVDARLFEDEGRSIVFTSIASRWAKNKHNQTDSAAREQEFLLDSLTMLAHDYSPQFGVFKADFEDNDLGLSEKDQLNVYDRYTDKSLSAAMTEAIVTHGLLDEAKSRLGITPENEDPYEVRVLSIDPKGMTSMGLDAPMFNGEDLATDLEKYYKYAKEVSELQYDVSRYQTELEQRSKNMAQELGREDAFGPAWVTSVDGKTLLCISMPTAEKILHPELTENASWYTEDYLERDKAFLEHEYTHTQGGANIDDELSFGINLEERRAEYFSGDKHGYGEIKNFFIDLRLVSGISVKEIFARFPKGGTKTEIYTELANTLGVDAMLEVLEAAPKNYLQDQSNRFQREAVQYLGGYDGIITRILEAQLEAGHGDEIDARIAERAQYLYEITEGDYESIMSYIRGRGLNVVADLIEQDLEKLREQKTLANA